jgi:hypothetical protein
MDKLYSWSAKRAGGRITVTHSCGKIAGIDRIEPEFGRVIAVDKDGRSYELHVTNDFEEGALVYDVDGNAYTVRGGRAYLNVNDSIGYDLGTAEMRSCFSTELPRRPDRV